MNNLSKNKVFYHPMAVQSPGFVTLIDEITEDLAKGNSNINLIKCEGQIKFCQSNLSGSKIACKFCINTFELILSGLKDKDKINIIPLKDNLNIKTQVQNFVTDVFETIDSFEALKKITYKGINVGYGIVSTYVSETRNNSWETVNHLIIRNLLEGALLSLENFEFNTSTLEYDEVILYNGRYHDNKPILNLAKLKSNKYRVLETIGARVKTNFKKHIFFNSTPHSIVDYTNNIANNWKESDLTESEKIKKGNEFFEKRRMGLAVADKSYTASQNDTDLSFIDINKKTLVIYNSSPDELFSLGEEWEWEFESQTNQASVIYFLCKNLQDLNIQIILRCHPNLATYKGAELQKYVDIQEEFENFTYISPVSKLNTYSILDKADYVLAFGSTIGIEAVYWNKISILIGTSFYQNLGAVFRATTLAEFRQILSSTIDVDFSSRKIQAAKYAFFMVEKKHNIKPFFKIIPTHPQIDGYMYYSLIKSFPLGLRLKILINVIINRMFAKL